MGEILHHLFNEVVGEDPETRRIASLPLRLLSTGVEAAGYAAILNAPALAPR